MEYSDIQLFPFTARFAILLRFPLSFMAYFLKASPGFQEVLKKGGF